jgi:hypothetical protein
MNESEWNELQRAWQSLPPEAEPVAVELERLRRRRHWFTAEIVIESVIAIAGIGVGAWMLTNEGALFIVSGIATLLLVAVVCVLSARARMAPRPQLDDAVERAVGRARQHVAVRVRLAAAMIWGIAAGMVFAGVMALARALLTTEANLAGFAAIGAVQLMMAAWLAFAFRYYQSRAADLARLEAIANSLEQ